MPKTVLFGFFWYNSGREYSERLEYDMNIKRVLYSSPNWYVYQVYVSCGWVLAGWVGSDRELRFGPALLRLFAHVLYRYV